MNDKILICFSLLICLSVRVQGQFVVSEPRTWDKYPPEALKRGFGLHQSETAQMDDDPALEEVLLFSAHNGHYPYFDMFRNYYVILDAYSREIQYVSDVVISTGREIKLEDRNRDGKFELYRRYIRDGKFTVDEKGNNLSAQWVYDTIEWKPEKQAVRGKAADGNSKAVAGYHPSADWVCDHCQGRKVALSAALQQSHSEFQIQKLSFSVKVNEYKKH